MIRLVLFLVALAAIAFGAGWIADRPGTVTIHWQGWQLETSVLVGLVALAALVIAALLVWSLISGMWRLPRRLSHAMHAQRRTRGLAALTRGIVAAGAGDPKTARRAAAEASRLLGHEPLTLLLKAQAAQLGGDRVAADAAFQDMANQKETRLLGLRGLWMEAQRRGDLAAARDFAETAVAESPGLPWATQAALETRAAAGDWAGATALLERNSRSGAADRASVKRLKAVLLTAEALAKEASEPDVAKERATAAARLEPTLVPAAVVAGRLLGRAGEFRRAAKILEAAWRAAPHPEIATTYVHLRGAHGSQDQLERARALQRTAPGGHVEGTLAVLRAALDAHDYAAARAAALHLVEEPTQRVCLLMAELEAAEPGNVAKAREWAARAVHAKPDPAWVADGYASDRWLPMSPITGRLDALEWKVPPIEQGGPVLDHAVETALLVADAASRLPAPAEAAAAPVSPAAAEPAITVPTPANEGAADSQVEIAAREATASGAAGDDKAERRPA